jgi:hypothetical protein
MGGKGRRSRGTRFIVHDLRIKVLMCPGTCDGHAGSTWELPKYVDPKKTKTWERDPERERWELEKRSHKRKGNE